MTIFYDSMKIGSRLRKALWVVKVLKNPATLLTSPPPKGLIPALDELRNTGKRNVIFTESFHGQNLPTRPYLGLTRVYDPKMQIVHMKTSAINIYAHELVHAVGGNELDAEAMEAQVSKITHEPIIITLPELHSFTDNPQGRYYHLDVEQITDDILHDDIILLHDGEVLWRYRRVTI